MKEMLERAERIREQIYADRHFLHSHPELGSDLPVSTQYIMQRLSQMGYGPREICPSGVAATVGRPGKTILLRADFDALPMEEQAQVPYKSVYPGKMHACGHDTHAAMLLGAARLLKDMEAELPGTVKLVFQPDEEGGDGAKSMVDAGVLEAPHVDAALALHTCTPAKIGSVRTRAGVNSSSVDSFIIRIQGKAGHGAVPSTAIDPINAAVQVYLAFQELMSRELPPFKNASLTFGMLKAGETANIIPHTAEMRGSLRTYDPEVRALMLERIGQIARGVSVTTRAEVSVEYVHSMPSVVNDKAMLACLGGVIEQLVGTENCLFESDPGAPSEDFAHFTEHVPGLYLALGFGDASDGCPYAGHHPAVIFRDEAMPVGTALYAGCALEWLKKNS